MTNEDAKKTLWRLSFTAGLSHTYYRKLSFALATVDRLVKISLGLSTLFGLALAYAPASDVNAAWWSFRIVVASAVLAAVLNVTPLDVWLRKFRALKIRWKELQGDINELELDAFGRLIDATFVATSKLEGNVDDGLSKAIRRALEKKQAIDVDEFFDWGWLEGVARREELTKRWGKGITTMEQGGLKSQSQPAGGVFS